MAHDRRLMVEFGVDSRVDEYRIRDWEVEFRARRPDGSALPDRSCEWRQLTAHDISLHFALRTPVGEWLTLRYPKAPRHR
jgi:hypothetical protein